jgi:anti-sigma factor RsiW
MNDHAHDELIQREIDGTNAPSESARLKALLQSDPEAKARFDALRRVSLALEGAERLEPPAELARGVMSAVRRGKAAPRPRFGGFPAVKSFTSRHMLAFAATFVLGLGMGVLLLQGSALSSRADRAALSGTALSKSRVAASKGGIQIFSEGGVHGEATTRVEGGLLQVELEIDSPRQIDVTLEGDGLSPRGFSQDGPAAGDVVLGAGRVRFPHAAGRRRYSLSFEIGEPKGGELRLGLGNGSVVRIGRMAS